MANTTTVLCRGTQYAIRQFLGSRMSKTNRSSIRAHIKAISSHEHSNSRSKYLNKNLTHHMVSFNRSKGAQAKQTTGKAHHHCTESFNLIFRQSNTSHSITRGSLNLNSIRAHTSLLLIWMAFRLLQACQRWQTRRQSCASGSR